MAKQIEFTVKKIQALPVPAGGSTRDEYRDTQEQGLYLRVTPRGVKTFSFVGRAKGAGKPERLTLGKFPQVRPEEARSKARELAGKLASGVSPAAAQRAKKGEMSVGELWKLYFTHISKTNKSPKSSEEVWIRWVAPRWEKRRLSEVTALDVEKWHLGLPDSIVSARKERLDAERKVREERRKQLAARQAIRRHGPDPKPRLESTSASKKVTGKASANKALQVLRAMYGFAIDAKRKYYEGVNPASNHQLHTVHARKRFIRSGEMPSFFEALAQEPSENARDCILLSLMAGQRRFNNISMRWSEINFAEAEWHLSGEFMKNGDPHIVPLVPVAVAILKRRFETRESESEFVFPSTRSPRGHMGAPTKAWQRIVQVAGITNLILHDLRRTLGSWQVNTGATLVVVGKGLNHKSPEATAIYAQLEMDPVRQAIGVAISAMFQAAGIGEGATVHQLPQQRKSGT